MSEQRPGERPPSVDALARSLADTGLPHPLLVDAARAAIAKGDPRLARIEAELLAARLLHGVLNATGVLLHTNLGRAPLALEPEATATNLEFDVTTGKRGSRFDGVGLLAARACGAESAIVVNNGAAAVLLVLAALGGGRQVAVSRGECVEIGGGFRIPEVAAQSGARLVDVGTTNRTRLGDYEQAISARGADVACVLRVHPSNFRIEGFASTVAVRDMGNLGVPVIVDVGSGLLDAACPWLPGGPPAWLAGEPAARQVLADGAAIVTFSGDKLLGGPQAGIIAGRSELVNQCARHPLARALRPGGLVLAALQHVLLAYLRHDVSEIPFWRMATTPVDVLRRRADQVAAAVRARGGPSLAIVESESLAGAGSVPGATIPSIAITLPGDRSAELRARPQRVIARVVDDTTLCDLRSIDPTQDGALIEALASVDAAR